MKKLIGFILILFVIVDSNANGKFIVKIGANHSNFIGEERNFEPGILFGIGREWSMAKNTVIIGEIDYVEQKSILKNKTIGGSDTSFIEMDIETYNINCSLRKIVVPLLVRQYWDIGKNWKIQLQAGLFLNIKTTDKSSRKFLYSTPNVGSKKVEYDYRSTTRDQNGSYSSAPYNCGLGFGVSWTCFQLECRYQSQDIAWFNFLLIHRKMESFQLMLGVNL